MAREGVFAGVDAELLPPIARPGLAALKLLGRKRAGSHGLSRAMEKLGPSYVKLGQFLATRPDIVSADVAHELERLQDRVAPLPRDVAVKRIEAAFQAPLGSVFVEFGEPVAAASIAQVHRAKVIDADGAERIVAASSAGCRATSPTWRSPRASPKTISATRIAYGRCRSSRRWRARCAWRWISAWRPRRPTNTART